MASRAVVSQQRRVFDDFFKVDELQVSHQQIDGTMSSAQRRLVLERGDAVAVLLFNRDQRAVLLVEQFRAPALVARRRDDPTTTDGWLLETLAGMVEAGESPEATAVREALEETGYRVSKPELIGRFFVSPGGTSERVFLYFAEVSDSDRVASGGGIDDEDIRVMSVDLDDLLRQLAQGQIEDAKLAISAYWLQSRLGLPE